MRKTDEITWYVVANASRARVVTLEAASNRSVPGAHTVAPALNEEFVGRNLKSRDVLADKLGQYSPHHPASPSVPHEHAKAGFALELADVLDKALNERRFDRLILIAPPEMLGNLRNALTEQVKHRVVGEQDKDLTQMNDKELAERLDKFNEQSTEKPQA
ncbi:MAG TPA: host attachment protein [Candidatus Binataceae bacterium]|nr:host attachment protein [Candidatus Binataceae bacterium]